ncbi:MAG: alpha/beta hydrolase [Lacipirellulaceae bacterium]
MTQHVEHDGCRFAYSARGVGVTALFVQGVGVQGDGWLPQVEALKGRFRCVSFDNRGMGASQPMAGVVSVERMARDALATLDSAGADDAHVVGHSLGGLVAMQLALDAPKRVRSLALFCTFASGREAAPLSWRMAWLGARSRIGTRAMRRRGFLRLVRPPGANDDESAAERLAELFGHDLADQPSVVPHQLRALRACDLRDRMAELPTVPTLIVSARHDPIAPPRVGVALHERIAGSRYVEVADASHGLPITHAQIVNSLLVDHFAAADNARRD